MQFTPQQLTGGARYGKQCRIGNWSEDLELEELKIKDYLKKKEGSELLVNARARKLGMALTPMKLSACKEDKTLKFGARVMLMSHKSEGYLSVNPFEEVIKDEVCTAATTSLNGSPSVRNVFTIERASTEDGFGDNELIHYGQDVLLSCEPFADMTEKTYVQSEHISPLAASKFTRKQEVVMHPKKTGGKCIFQFVWPDVKQRFENDAMLLRVDVPICLRHIHTGRFLASDKVLYVNMFGGEFEVHAHNYVSTNKTQNLCSEQKGMITGDYQLRRTGLENIWTLITDAPADEVAAFAGEAVVES